MVNADAWGIAVNADAQYDDVAGFVKWLKANPNAKVSDGGPATAYHWAWEAFMDKFGVQLKTVTYKGGTAGGLKAVAGEEVVAAGAGANEADSMAKAGLVKMIGIAAEERNAVYGTVPTFAEQGFEFVFGPVRGFARTGRHPRRGRRGARGRGQEGLRVRVLPEPSQEERAGRLVSLSVRG